MTDSLEEDPPSDEGNGREGKEEMEEGRTAEMMTRREVKVGDEKGGQEAGKEGSNW